MSCLTENFSVHTGDAMRVRKDILAGIQYGTSGFESFDYVEGASLSSVVAGKTLPNRELLHKPRQTELASITGGSVEDFYKLCHQLKLDEDVDSLILKKFLPQSLEFEGGVSINLCSRTAYGQKLPIILDNIEHDPQKVMLEISESKTKDGSRIPAEYNPKALDALKSKGYRFAMDDLDPFRRAEWHSLSVFEFIDAVKFPHEIASLLRKGDPNQVDMITHQIWAIGRLCPSAILIMEGIRSTDQALIPLLADAGVHAYQKSKYVDSVKIQPRPAGLELSH